MKNTLLAAALIVLSAAGLLAQNRSGMAAGRGAGNVPHPIAPAHSRSGWTVRVGSGFGYRARGYGRGSYGYYGVPYYSDFSPGYYDDYDSAPPPRPPAPEPAAAPASPEPLPSPALLELQGSQWVKVSSFTMNQPLSESTLQTDSVVPAKALPPAVLVYRDGHTEELNSYSIIGTSIYTKSDYWTNGAWTRAIQIADLDVVATLKANQQRGVKFEFPSGPNEVMIRQ